MTDYAVINFRDLQDAVLENRFRDTTTNRLRAKKMLNTRYQQLVGMEDWPFRYKVGNFTSTLGSQILTSPSDFGVILGLTDDQGNPIPSLPQDTFVANLYPSLESGTANYFTTLAGKVYVSPKADGVRTYVGHYRAWPALMQNDADEPDLIPVGHRFVLVHGARADMLQDLQDPAWRDEETIWQGGIQAMQRDLLAETVGGMRHWPDDPTWG